MPPFQRNWPVPQPYAPSSPKTSSSTPPSSKQSSTLEPGLVSPQCTLSQAHGQSNATTSDEDGSPPPHYTPTYVDRAAQTSPLLPTPHPFLYHAHAQPYPCPVAYVYGPPVYSHPMPWLPPPFVFPAVPSQASFCTQISGNPSEQRGYQNMMIGPRATRTSIPSGAPTAAHPFYAYYPYQHQLPPVNLPLAISTENYPPDASPLIAPLPQLPLPRPEALSLSEPSSPTISTTTAVSVSLSTLISPPTSLIHRRSISTLPPHAPVSPVENPFHTLYKSLRSLLLISEPDPSFLAREINGEQLVSVHGVGIWSCRGNVPPLLEAAKRNAFQAHGSYDAWVRAARARTAHYATSGAVRPPLRWVLIENKGGESLRPGEQKGSRRRHKWKKDKIMLPDDALQTGTEANGERLYCARAWLEGGVHVGKAAAHLQDGGASISYGSLEHSLSTFEILVGDQQYAKWVDVPKGTVLNFQPPPEAERASLPHPPAQANVDITSRPGQWPGICDTPQDFTPLRAALPASFTPIEGGREANGEPLFVAQAEYERGWHPGKARLGEDHCCIAYGGGELWVKGFRVLGYIV